MILDIITAALIIIPMGIGMAKGFLYIVVRLLGWLGALAMGVFMAPFVKDLLEKSFVGAKVHEILMEHIGGTAENVTSATDSLPTILSGSIDSAVQNEVELLANALQGLVLTVMAFLLMVIAVRLVLILVIRPISKLKGDGPVSFANKLGGMIVGGAEGLLLAFLFLAALIPVMQMASPETAESISEGLKFSYLAGSLYDGNLLLAIFG